ncbi:MAG TPA: cytochrome d ubiquinol oxidase subunit II [Jatrophihabitans sp.]|nr:cytochrome d ubiquinol oxidase subunit II [Jatrophihabitans sp.]
MQAFWFGVIAVLWAGFFLLEGFDFGVGMLLPAVARTDERRQLALRTIGPVWDGNEVWLLVAGGATFAAFPEWYASVFSGFYLAFAVLLVGLIVRGIGLEYRGKAHTATGRSWCDAGIVVGSFLPALLLGVAFANFARGVKLDAAHVMTGSFFDLLSPYALLGGLVTLSLFLFHGSTFLALRTDGEVAAHAQRLGRLLGPAATVLGAIFLVWTATHRHGAVSLILAVLLAAVLIGAVGYQRAGRSGAAFVGTAVATVLVPIWAFAALWPNVLPASNNAANSLTIHNASSSHYTLTVMTVVALIFTPIVLAYQAWTYWVFRARVTGASLTPPGSATGQLIQRARESAQQAVRPQVRPADATGQQQ